MAERRISVDDVRRTLATGAVIEAYPDDRPYPSRLLLGWIGERPIHVVAATDPTDEITIVITADEPDAERWEPGFRRRRA